MAYKKYYAKTLKGITLEKSDSSKVKEKSKSLKDSQLASLLRILRKEDVI
jgi:hypothetical protein